MFLLQPSNSNRAVKVSCLSSSRHAILPRINQLTHDRFAGFQGSLERLDRLRPDVETHPLLRDGVYCNGLHLRICVEL